MAKPRKVIRTKTLYKSKKIFSQRVGGRLFFLLLVVLLIGIGYIVMREWSSRFGSDADKIKPPKPTSSVQDSSNPESLGSESSEPTQIVSADFGKTANLSAERVLALQGNIASELASLKGQGYTAVSIELKAENGMLSYKSTNEMAAQYGTVSENAVDLAALKNAITEAGLTPIARISTLKDPRAPHVSKDNSYAYSTSLETNWLDNSLAQGGKPWLNPYMENARKYICDLSKEISVAGIETIVLENVIFPDKNVFKMNTILTTPEPAQMLNQFVNEVQAAVGDKVNIIRQVNAVALAAGETRFDANIFAIPSKQIGLTLDLAAIEANKQKICTQNGIVDQVGYDKNITAAAVAGHLIEQAKQEEDVTIIPIVSQQDFAALEQVFVEKGIANYIII